MNNAGTLVDSSLLGLPVDQQFAIHAAAVAIKELDREELEEAFVDMLHQKATERQIFLNILKEHGINADINFNYLNENDF
jgi:hypothetical protein